MFKVGDIVKLKGGRRGDRYKIIAVHPVYPNSELTLCNILQTDPCMNFVTYNYNHFELDKIYMRKEKLDNIRNKINSLNSIN